VKTATSRKRLAPSEADRVALPVQAIDLWLRGNRQRKPVDAEQSYREALRLAPGHAALLSNLAQTLDDQGRGGEALGLVTDALASAEEPAALLSAKARILERREDYYGALEAILEAAKLAPHDETLESRRKELLEKRLSQLVNEGFATWSGGKPQGLRDPVDMTPGPYISDYVIQDRG